MNRRSFLKWSAGAGIASAIAPVTASAKPMPNTKPTYQNGTSPWPICLNTSTIRPVNFMDKIKIASQTGYDGVELWMDDLEKHEAEGANLKDLGKQIRDMGMFVPNVIGLWNCMPATQEEWEKSLAATRDRMRRAADVGSIHVAAIPAPDRPDFDLKWGVDRYRDLLKIGREEYGITVAFEFVGFFQGVHRLGQGAAIAIDADDPDACLVMDTFHLYRGGSGFEGIDHLNSKVIAVFHWNDLPPTPAREQIGDEHRIYPGDGILPLKRTFNLLSAINYRGPLSLEMFNREHWAQDPVVVAKTALDKTRTLIAAAGAESPKSE